MIKKNYVSGKMNLKKIKVSRSYVVNKIKIYRYADSNIKENADFFMECGG